SLAEIEIRAPSHTLGELILPFTNVTNLTLNGIPLIQAGLPLDASLSFQTDGLHLALSKRPEYRFTVEHPCP
ncbi:MAG: hypothetical protein HUU38_09610, partial [Anaerolineales bacterium]|nr:hypothetical protein [Anaerolineales bacterium]